MSGDEEPIPGILAFEDLQSWTPIQCLEQIRIRRNIRDGVGGLVAMTMNRQIDIIAKRHKELCDKLNQQRFDELEQLKTSWRKASAERLRAIDETCPLSEDARRIIELCVYHDRIIHHLAENGSCDGGIYCESELRRIREQLNKVSL